MANGNNIGAYASGMARSSYTPVTPDPLITTNNAFADLEAQNEAVRKWASMVQQHLRGATVILQHGKDGTVQRGGGSFRKIIKDSNPMTMKDAAIVKKNASHTERKLENSIRIKERLTYGVITGESFVFERHGVFVHKGVGRGYKMYGGMVIRTAKSEEGTRRREPYEWFNPVIEQSLPELADKLAEINADAAVNATRMMIK